MEYRFWDSKEKIMYINNSSFAISFNGEVSRLLYCDGNTESDCVEWEGTAYSEHIIPLQGTDLYDDFGKRIYDGDIVEVQNSYETKTPYKSKVFLNSYGVRIEEHPSHIKMGITHGRNLTDFCDYGIGGMYNVKCKVIGNIYENPELLD